MAGFGGRGAELAALGAHFAGVTDAIRATEEAAKLLGSSVQTVGVAMRSTLAETAVAATKVAESVQTAAGAWNEQQIAMLERLRQMVIPYEGSDAGSQYSFDRIIEDQIAKIRAGETTVAEAIRELQRQFGTVYGTLQDTFFGSQDAATRDFLTALLNFINSGRLL